MAKTEVSELHLTAIIAIATALGGIIAASVDKFWIDASIQQETNAQMVELAINILSEEIEPSLDETPEKVLRGWAVDTLNQVALVQLDDEAKQLLRNGDITLISKSFFKLQDEINKRQNPILFETQQDLLETFKKGVVEK